MENNDLDSAINDIFVQIEKKIPEFETSYEDWSISEGNVAICIINPEGKVYGKMYGSDKIKQRGFYSVAWKKASQVWITGHNTGDYEKIVFGGEMDPEASPIELPDLIGWVGGQKISVKNEELSVGFSGFRGFNDLKIVQDAVRSLGY